MIVMSIIIDAITNVIIIEIKQRGIIIKSMLLCKATRPKHKSDEESIAALKAVTIILGINYFFLGRNYQK